MRDILSLVVPTDFSDCSLEALDEAVELAMHFGAKIHVLHCIETLSRMALSTKGETDLQSFYQLLYNEADAQLAALEPRLRGVDYDTAVKTGRAARSIVEYANEVDADLIVISTHGRRGIARIFVGSTTEEVVRRSTRPVLTVSVKRIKEPGEQEESATSHDIRGGTADFREVVPARATHIQVRDVMRRDGLVVHPDTRVHEVIDLMIHHDISGVPVVNERDELVGYIPESPLLVRSVAEISQSTAAVAPEQKTLHLQERDEDVNEEEGSTLDGLIERQRRIHGKSAREVMVPADQVVTVEEDASLTHAVRLMLNRHVSRVPVLHGRVVVGSLTRADVLRAVRALDKHKKPVVGDDEVSRLVRLAVEHSTGVAVSDLIVRTEAGVVTMYGSVTDEDEIEHATAIVTRVPGVKAVANCLLVEDSR